MQSNVYIILLLAHLVSDFLFQPTGWATEKKKRIMLRFLHSLQYTIIFLPIFYFLKINFFWLLYLFMTHFIIDSYVIIRVWNKYIKGFGKTYKIPEWFEVMQDQILHLLLLLPLSL